MRSRSFQPHFPQNHSKLIPTAHNTLSMLASIPMLTCVVIQTNTPRFTKIIHSHPLLSYTSIPLCAILVAQFTHFNRRVRLNVVDFILVMLLCVTEIVITCWLCAIFAHDVAVILMVSCMIVVTGTCLSLHSLCVRGGVLGGCLTVGSGQVVFFGVFWAGGGVEVWKMMVCGVYFGGFGVFLVWYSMKVLQRRIVLSGPRNSVGVAVLLYVFVFGWIFESILLSRRRLLIR
mmetsp:Transcript_41989/g.48316  ORF Transcript_41989/g.48316 Transcript_41989/m.48316 type:complete len:231 (-) Transcript_41989:18-710(-)